MTEEFKGIVDSSYDNGIPLWIYTKDYIYGLVPADAGGLRWIEISYTFEDDDPLVKTERNANLSYQFLLEEVEKGLAFYIEDLNVNKIKDFARRIEGKSSTEKINALIAELINNSSDYSTNLPIIKSKEELGKLKENL
ncbi:MAG: hypothetical protein ACFFAN_04595 [Promethearchaeota archaeon]